MIYELQNTIFTSPYDNLSPLFSFMSTLEEMQVPAYMQFCFIEQFES